MGEARPDGAAPSPVSHCAMKANLHRLAAMKGNLNDLD